MENIKIEKVYEDYDMIEIKISLEAEYINLFQFCYIQSGNLASIGNKILNYSFEPKDELYVEFGVKNGNYTPAFSLLFFPASINGKVKIEADMEIADDSNEDIRRKHRASFYVYTELGLVENLGKDLIELSQQDVYIEIVL